MARTLVVVVEGGVEAASIRTRILERRRKGIVSSGASLAVKAVKVRAAVTGWRLFQEMALRRLGVPEDVIELLRSANIAISLIMR